MKNRLFKKYRARIVHEGILKASLCGSSIGCAMLSVCALVSWLVGFKPGLFIALGLFVVVCAVSIPLFYHFCFRPTDKSIAARMDALGLEERVITMVELEGDDSFIAQKQREDTKHVLGRVNSGLVKMAVSVSMIVLAVIAGTVALSFTAVDSLYYAGIIPGGEELWYGEPSFGEYQVTYSVKTAESGFVVFWTDDWEKEEKVTEAITVSEGEDAPAVLAVPEPDYVFVGWSDGVRIPYRQDLEIRSNLEVLAIFEPLDETLDRDETPPEEQRDSDGDGSSAGQGSGEGPSNGITDTDLRDASNNQIVDGQTFYGDPFEEAYKNAMDRLTSDENLSSSMKEWITDYLDSIAQDGADEDEGGE